MAKKLDEAQVRKTAKLARLDLTDEEVTQFSSQLSGIIEYIEKLNELDTDNVEPLAHCLPVHNIFRKDEITASLGTEKTLANAPDSYEEYFKVPKVLDDNSGA